MRAIGRLMLLVGLVGCFEETSSYQALPSARHLAPDPSPSPPPDPPAPRDSGAIELTTRRDVGWFAATFRNAPAPTRTVTPFGCRIEDTLQKRGGHVASLDAGDIRLERVTEPTPITSIHWRSATGYESSVFRRKDMAQLGPLVVRGTGGWVYSFDIFFTPLRALAITKPTTGLVVDGSDLEVEWQTEDDALTRVELVLTTNIIVACGVEPGVHTVTIPAALVAEALAAHEASGNPSCEGCASVNVYLSRTKMVTLGEYDIATTHTGIEDVALSLGSP